MRNILFRGQGKDNQKWYKGYYWYTEDIALCPVALTEKDIQQNSHHYILMDGLSDWNLPIPKYKAEIKPETLCQFTGGEDKNGTQIFEHDIVKSWKTDDEDGLAEILWDKDTARFIIWWKGDLNLITDFDNFDWKDLEIVGNSFDNPELIE